MSSHSKREEQMLLSPLWDVLEHCLRLRMYDPSHNIGTVPGPSLTQRVT